VHDVQIRDYVTVLIKRGWIIILVAAMAAAGAYVFTRFQPVIYRSSIKLLVVPARSDYGLTLAAGNLLRQYSVQVTARDLVVRTIDELRLDTSVEALKGNITVSSIPEDYIIQIDVYDRDMDQAPKIADKLAAIFVEDHALRQKEIERRDRVEISIYEPASPPAMDSPKTRTTVLAGGAFGLLLGAVIAFGLEYLDDSLKTTQDVERYVPGVTVLATVPPITPVTLADRETSAAEVQAGVTAMREGIGSTMGSGVDRARRGIQRTRRRIFGSGGRAQDED
jgi:capsular polysaccharide biosynthesis protein